MGEQAVIATQSSDLVVGGKGEFIGGALTTATPEDNKTVFKQGIETQDIINHSRYEGDSISAGISIGNTTGKPQANMNGIGYGSDGDDRTSTTFAGVTGMAGKSEVTTGTKDSLNEELVNSFDEQKVTEELNAQVQITQAFDQERRKIKSEIYADVDKKREQATNIRRNNGGYDKDESIRLEVEAAKLDEKARWIDAGMGAIWGLGDADMLKGMFGVTQAVRAKRSATAPKEMWYQTCSASTGGQCESRQIWSLSDLTEEELNLIKKGDQVVTVSNPGIFNDKEASLANAAKQNTNETNKIGTLVVMNPPTGKYDGWWILSSATSELMYAGYDKLNDILGGKLPLTNSEKLNQDIYLEAMGKGLQIDPSSHSRGGLTSSVALKDLNNNQGINQYP